jgi:hypothetical protein
MLEAVDSYDGCPTLSLESMEMLWDTGAHRTIITEEILPRDFRDYLKDPIHDAYRGENGTRVQMQAVIEFSNSTIEIEAIAWVLSHLDMPNERVGILFGQSQCIDRLVYRTIPRSALQAKGEDITKDFWGDIIVEEYVNGYDELSAV